MKSIFPTWKNPIREKTILLIAVESVYCLQLLSVNDDLPVRGISILHEKIWI